MAERDREYREDIKRESQEKLEEYRMNATHYYYEDLKEFYQDDDEYGDAYSDYDGGPDDNYDYYYNDDYDGDDYDY